MDLFSAENLNIFLKLFVALILGGCLGMERTLAHKAAGLRTYGLVSMGSALFVIISEIVGQRYLDAGSFDPLRTASQIVVGIGFIGAGLIIFRESKLSGLTTAAGLWVSAAMGTAVGFGLYAIAIFVAVLTIFVFTIFWFFERKIEKIADENND